MNARGTRDFSTETLAQRAVVVNVLKGVFQRYGFVPLETPAIERLDTLEGKYGDEGEKLLFRIMERGGGNQADLGLRYDLTVPLARFVAQNPNLPMPFKRYQVQPVWRADRPQKGRYREFYQCDVDIVGSASPVADAEVITVWSDCLSGLGFTDFEILVNHRSMLDALIAKAGLSGDVLSTIDKLDKIGLAGVSEELERKGASEDSRRILLQGLENASDMSKFENPEGLQEVMGLAESMGAQNLRFDGSLARGMSYYTGPIFEARIKGGGVGSVGGGGRYDKLLKLYGSRDLPATGSSLGLERILTVMIDRGMIQAVSTAPKVFLTLFSKEQRPASLALAGRLRQQGLSLGTWLGEPGSLGKQIKQAVAQGSRYALILGPEEQEKGVIMLKDLMAGTQLALSEKDLTVFLVSKV